jgi:hypothetical protein
MKKVISQAQESGIAFDSPEDDCLRIIFPGKNAESIAVDIYFSETENNVVELICFGIAAFADDRLQNGLVLCNELNRQMENMKFYTIGDTFIPSAQFYFLNEEDFGFQIEKALEDLIKFKTLI